LAQSGIVTRPCAAKQASIRWLLSTGSALGAASAVGDSGFERAVAGSAAIKANARNRVVGSRNNDLVLDMSLYEA